MRRSSAPSSSSIDLERLVNILITSGVKVWDFLGPEVTNSLKKLPSCAANQETVVDFWKEDSMKRLFLYMLALLWVIAAASAQTVTSQSNSSEVNQAQALRLKGLRQYD